MWLGKSFGHAPDHLAFVFRALPVLGEGGHFIRQAMIMMIIYNDELLEDSAINVLSTSCLHHELAIGSTRTSFPFAVSGNGLLGLAALNVLSIRGASGIVVTVKPILLHSIALGFCCNL